MFRSLHMKLVMIMLLLVTSLMAVVGAFLMTSITNFYIDDFYEQMSEVFGESNAAFVNTLRFMIQGLSFTKQAIFAGIFEMIARCVCGFWLTDFWGYPVICFANAAAWICADFFLIPAYFHSVNLLRRRHAQSLAAQPAGKL